MVVWCVAGGDIHRVLELEEQVEGLQTEVLDMQVGWVLGDSMSHGAEYTLYQ